MCWYRYWNTIGIAVVDATDWNRVTGNFNFDSNDENDHNDDRSPLCHTFLSAARFADSTESWV